jgi:Na+/melibiose symporter-like transporter
MLTILKVLFRICLIAVGLLAIGAGGLCVMFGSASRDGVWIALIGLLGVVGGGFTVWWVFNSWRKPNAGDASSGGEQQS